ncbi:metal-dependent hydrolase [Nonomuraea sp. NPDC023979]|uniref:metal-dependent hydrolase n=1 Tax=Nonomuraea sp. NPDC023979 TaxID=3154796 RepID=UPI003402DC57
MATGRTHAACGLTAYVGAVSWAHESGYVLDLATVITLAPLAAGAALLPDLDHPDATMARSLGWPSRQLARLVSTLGGGHRGLTHSLTGAAVFGGLGQLALAWRDTVSGQIGLSILVALLIASAVRVCGIRGWLDDAVGIALGPFLVGAGVPLDGLPLVVAGGCLVHLIGDLPTDRGLPLLWPMRGCVRLPRALTFKVDGPAERRVIFPAVMVALAVCAGWGSGLWALLGDAFATFQLLPS